jgi:hypothetical protein
MTSARKYDQIVCGNIKIDKDKTNEIRITFFEISSFLLYQIWSSTDKVINTNRRVLYQDASDWVLNNFTNYNRQPKFKPTSIMDIYNNRYVMVINDAKINKKGQIIFLCSEIQYSCKNKIPCGKFKNVRFDIDATTPAPLAPAILNAGPWYGIIITAQSNPDQTYPNLYQQNWTSPYSNPVVGNYIDGNSPAYFSGVAIDSYQNVYVLGELNSTHYIFIYTNNKLYIGPNQNYYNYTNPLNPPLNQINLNNTNIYAIEIPSVGNELPFNNYSAIALDVNNNIYITATETNIVYYIESVENLFKSTSQQITYLTPKLTTLISDINYPNFIYPTGICIDGNGYLYIGITNGVVCYQTPSLSNLRPDATYYIDGKIYGISVDINNNILVCVGNGSTNNGVYVLSFLDDEFKQVTILSTGKFIPVCIAVDNPNPQNWNYVGEEIQVANAVYQTPNPNPNLNPYDFSAPPQSPTLYIPPLGNPNIVVTCYDGNIFVFQSNSTNSNTYTPLFNPVNTINYNIINYNNVPYSYSASTTKPYILGITFNIGNLLLISTNTTNTNPIGFFKSNQIYAF